MATILNNRTLTRFEITSSVILALVFGFFTLQILLTNVNAEAVANNTINQAAAIAPLNNIQLNFSVYSNSTAASWIGNLTNVTIVFQTTAGATLLNVSGGTVSTTAGYGTRLLNLTTLNFFNTTSSDLFTANGQQLSFSVNVTAIKSGNYTIFINTTYNSTKLGNSTTVWLNVVNGTITLTNATFTNFTYNGQNLVMNFTGIASSPTGGGSINDNITFLLYNTTWQSTNYSSNGIGTANYTNATAGTYALVFNTTGTNNYTSTSLTAVLNISKAVPVLGTFIAGLLGNQTVTFPTSVQILGNATYGNSTPIPEPTFNIYVANVTQSSPTVLITSSGNPVTITNTYGNGTYQIIYNTTGSVNFTSAQNITAFLLVNKGNLANYLDVSIDGYYVDKAGLLSSNHTVFGRFNSTGASDITFKLFSNGTDVQDAENATSINRTQGTYIFTYGTLAGTAANWTVGNSTNRTLIVDGTVPTYSNLASSVTNGTTVRRGIITISVQWSDGMALYSWGKITNMSGSRVDTNTTTFQTGNWTNVTFDTSGCDTPHTSCPVYLILATNDTAGNQNLTYYEWIISNVCGDGYCDTGELCPSDCHGFGYENTASGGGGGGGGGGTIISGIEFSQTTSLATSDSPAVINVSPAKAKDLKVDQVTLEVNDVVNNVKVTVKESALPTGANFAISTDTGATYKYLDITSTVPSEKLDKVTIKFKVEKSWVANNSIDTSTIALERYANSQWSKLTTTLVNQDSTYYYFEAVSPGLSTFAIIGAKVSAVTTPTTPTQQCPACDPCTAWSDCLVNNQTRTCYKCDVSTAYKCQSYSETKDCTPVIGQAVKTTWQTIVSWVVVIGGLIVIIWLLVKRRKPAKVHHTNHE